MIRIRFRVLALGQPLLLGILIVSWVSVADTGEASRQFVPAAPPSQAPFDYAVIIVMNNASAQSIYGNPAAPYLNSLASTHGFATNYAAIEENAVPNYLSLIGGTNFVTASCEPTECPINAVNIVDRIEGAGLTWKAWAEDYPIPQGCSTALENFGYGARHFPFVYFQDIINNPARCSKLLKANSQVVPAPGTETPDLFLNSLGSTSTAANYMWLTPNGCDDMHACSISTGDTYLSLLVPRILNSYIFTTQKAALFITFAEGTATVCPCPTDYVPAIWAGPVAKTGFQSSNQYNHYSLLRTIETAWGLPPLTSNDDSADPMSEFFTPPPLRVGFTYSPSTPVVEQTITLTATAGGGTPPYTSFRWNFGDGTTGTGATTTHIYRTAGNFPVTVRVTDAESVSATSIIQSVAVAPVLSAVTLGFSPATPEVGIDVMFIGTVNGGGAPFRYVWTFGDGTTATTDVNTAIHSYSTTGTFRATVRATDASGVSVTSSASSVTVAAALTSADFTFAPTSPEVGTIVAFTATKIGGVAPFEYQWSFGDGNIPETITNTVSHVFNSTGRFTVTVEVDDVNSVTVISPAHNITVVTPLATTFSFSPATPETGTVVTFTASASGSLPPYTYNWNFGDGSSASSGNPATHAYATPGTFTVTVTVRAANGATASASRSVTVAPRLSVDFTFSPTTPEGTQTVTFTATRTGGIGTVIYSWNFGDASPAATGNAPTHSYASPGTFTVTLTATDANGVTATASHPIVVAPRLTVEFTLNPATPDGGQTVTFTATRTGGVGTISYTWNFGDNSPTGSGSPTTHTYADAGTFTVTVTATDGNGVTATISHSVVVAPRLAVASVISTPSSSEVGFSVSFSATTTGGVGTKTFNWDFGDGSPAGSGSPTTHIYTTSATRTVTVTVTDGNGVTATGTVSIVVNARLAVAPTAVPSPATIGQVISFTAAASGGVSPVSCDWNFGDGETATVCGATHAYDSVGTFTATVSATDALAVTATRTVSVVVNDACSVDFTFVPAAPEGGQAVTFTATTANCASPVVFTWNFGNSDTASGNPATTTYPDAGGAFTVTVGITDANEASATTSQTLTVARRLSAVDFTFAPPSPEAGVSVSFTATRTGGIAPYTYAWNFGDSSSDSSSNPASHTYATSGTFTVVLTVTDATGVTATALRIAVVVPRLAVDFTFSPSTPEGGQTVTLTATTTGGVGTIGHSWNFGDGSPSGNGSPTTHAYANAGGTFSVVVTASDGNGVTVTASHTVTVVPRLAVASVAGTPNPSETGVPVNFSATTTGGLGTKTFSWDFKDDSPPSSANTTSHTYDTPGTRTVTVTVTDGNGVTATGTVSVVVNARLALAPGASPNPGTVGHPVSFSAGIRGGVSPVSCSWTFGDNGTATECTATHTYVSVGSFTATVTASDALTVTATGTVSVTVNDACSVDFTWSPSSPEGGQAVTFTANTPNCLSPVEFEWDFGNSDTASGIPATTTYPNAGGTFTVNVTTTDASNSIATMSHTVIVAPRLSVASATGTPNPSEVDVPVNFSATTSGGVGSQTFTWSFGDGSPVGSGNTTPHTYATSGTRTVTVTVVDGNGVTATRTVSVVVNARLALAPTASPNPATAEQPASFNAGVTGGVSPASCNWTFGDNGTAIGCTVTHTYAVSGTFIVNVTAVDALSVTATRSVSVTVNDACSVDFTWSPSSPEGGQVVEFTATTANCVSVSLAWDLGNGDTASGRHGDTIYPVAGGTFTVNVTVTSDDTVIATASHTLVVAPRLSAVDFTFTPSSPEVGVPVSFTATQTGGVAPYTYTWNFGDGSSTAGGNPATHTYSSGSGTFNARLTVKDANNVTLTVSRPVVVAPRLTVSFTFSPSTPEGGQTVTLTATTTGGVGTIGHSWNFGDGSPTGSGSPTTHAYDIGGGSFNVTVTATDGNGVAATTLRTLVVAPRLSTPSFTFTPSSPEGGQSVTFTGNQIGGVAPYSYSWNFGDSSSTGSGNPKTHTYASPGGTFNVTLTVIDSNGVTSSASREADIAPRLSAVDFTFTPSSPEVGVSVSLTATRTGGIAPYTYAWNFGDGSPADSNVSPSHTYTTARTFTVTLTVTDSNGVAASSASRSVVVATRLSAAEFTINPTNPEGGQIATFTGTQTAGVSPYTYTWNFGDGSPAESGNSATQTYGDQGGNFNVTLTVTDANRVTATVSRIVAVAPRLAVASVTGTPNPSEIGVPVNFSATTAGGVGAMVSSWDFGDGSTGSRNPSTHTYAASGTFDVTLTVTDANNVTATASLSVLVSPRLSVNLTFSPTSPEGGQTVSFTATRTGGVGTVSYSWSFGDVSSAGSGNPASHVYGNAGGTFTVTVTATDGNGVTATISHSVVVAPRLAVASVARTPNPSEVGVSVNFSATAIDGIGTKTFTWSFGDGSPAASGNTTTHTYTTPATRTVTVTVTDGNGVTATGTVSVVVNARLALAPVASPNPVTASRVVSFNPGAIGGVSLVSCSWNFGDGGTATQCNTTHTYASAGTFTVNVTATDSNGVSANGSVSAIVNPLPRVSATADPGPTNVGVSVSFFALASGGTGSVTFVWNFGDGSPAGSGNPVSHLYSNNGTFIVTVTVTDSIGVPASNVLSLVVNPPPIMDFTSSPANPSAGSPVTFTSTIGGGTGPFTFSWNFGDGSTGSGNPVNHTYAGLGTFTISLTKRDSNGAIATTTHSISLTTWNKPPVFASPSASQTAILGQPLTFAVVASDPEGEPVSIVVKDLPPEASFDPGTGQFSWTPTADQTGDYSITFTATDTGTPSMASSHTIAIQVKPGPSRTLGLLLDDGVATSLAFLGVISILVVAIVAGMKDKGESDSVGPGTDRLFPDANHRDTSDSVDKESIE